MKTIIAATDFSASAENALNYAADLALVVNADLLLLHVNEIPVVYLEIPVAYNEDALLKAASKNLDELKERLIARTGGKLIINTEVRTGMFLHELQNVCEETDVHTVIIGSQGKSFSERLLFGNRAIDAIRSLKHPLITVPAGVQFSSIKKIGLACDLRRVADTIPEEEIKILVHELQAELHILNIDRVDVFNPKTDYESVILEKKLASLNPKYHFITNENTDNAIINFAEKNNIDLLIVFPKRRGLLKRLVQKSHTKNLVLHAHMPLLTYHKV